VNTQGHNKAQPRRGKYTPNRRPQKRKQLHRTVCPYYQ